MKVTMMLADAAQSVGGKLYILGGGWTVTGPGPIQMGIAIKMEIDWARANQKIPWKLDLVDEDGRAVRIPHPPDGEVKPLSFDGELEVGRPPGLREGTPLDAAMALNFNSLALPADSRFTWRFHLDDQTDTHWQCSFTTRPVSAAQGA